MESNVLYNGCKTSYIILAVDQVYYKNLILIHNVYLFNGIVLSLFAFLEMIFCLRLLTMHTMRMLVPTPIANNIITSTTTGAIVCNGGSLSLCVSAEVYVMTVDVDM